MMNRKEINLDTSGSKVTFKKKEVKREEPDDIGE